MLLLSGLCLLLGTVLFVSGVAAETDTNDSDTAYQVVQGERVVPVEPIEGDEPVEEFYEYRHPEVGDRDHPFWGRSFSSEGTVEYQQDDTSILMLYDGPDGVSLVAIHDRYHEDQSQGTTGGSVSWEFSGLPEDGEWAVIDDDYGWYTDDDHHDDRIYLDDDHQAGAAGNDGEPPNDADAMLSWVWLTGRTDGMVFRGIGTEPSISIDPAFNTDSYHRYGDQRRADEPPDRPGMGERYNGTINDWQVIIPTDDGEFDRVSLESLDEPVEIHSPDSETDSDIPEITVESVTLNESTIEPNEEAVISVVVENSGEADGSYPVRLEVGGTVIQTETVEVAAGEQRTVEFTQPFSSPGDYELSVHDEQVTLSVETLDDGGPGAAAPESASETDDTIPGFGVVGALIALVVAAVAVRVRD